MPNHIITTIDNKGKSQSSASDKFIFKRNDKSFLTSLAVQDDQLLLDFYAAEGANDAPANPLHDNIHNNIPTPQLPNDNNNSNNEEDEDDVISSNTDDSNDMETIYEEDELDI